MLLMQAASRRAISRQKLGTVLSIRHFRTGVSRLSRGATRFNPGPSASPRYGIAYVAPDAITALLEVEALLGSVFSVAVPNPFRSSVVLRYQVPTSVGSDCPSAMRLHRRTRRRRVSGSGTCPRLECQDVGGDAGEHPFGGVADEFGIDALAAYGAEDHELGLMALRRGGDGFVHVAVFD